MHCIVTMLYPHPVESEFFHCMTLQRSEYSRAMAAFQLLQLTFREVMQGALKKCRCMGGAGLVCGDCWQ